MPRTNRSAIKNGLLAALSQEDLDQFFSDLYPVSLSLRQILCETGGPLEHVYFLEEGVASVLTTMANGATIEVGMIGAEGMVGLPALLGGRVSAQHVVIQIPGNALRMNAALCKTGFDQSATIRATFLRFTEGILNLSAQTAACNRLHAIDQRCARWLLMAFDRIQSDVMPMTQEFLSSMLGVRRAGVTEAAGELQRSGLIRYQHGRITLIDREGLEASACECYRIDHERLLQLLRRVGSSSTEPGHLRAVH
jgi:CRP-like cAMP-binding protein